MPTYEYECLKCGHKFEKFQNMSDELIKECPQCNGNVRRLIGAGTGIIFKGSGFYATDYKNNSSQNASCCGLTNPCSNTKRCCEKQYENLFRLYTMFF